mgnify:CR=1 FL=1
MNTQAAADLRKAIDDICHMQAWASSARPKESVAELLTHLYRARVELEKLYAQATKA